jgi:gas vesicle protein
MEENNNGTKLLLAFLAGAVVGVAVGYLLNSDKKDVLIDDLKESASKIKDDIKEGIEKGKTIIDTFINTTKDNTQTSA